VFPTSGVADAIVIVSEAQTRQASANSFELEQSDTGAFVRV
jgi:hypothetical protein